MRSESLAVLVLVAIAGSTFGGIGIISVLGIGMLILIFI